MKFPTLCLLCLWSCTALGQSAFIVVPNNLANLEGNSSISEPFTSSSFRFQQVFHASQFAVPPGGFLQIHSISFRIDGASTNQVLLSFGGSSVTLSTTQRAPESLSPVFADNAGSDALTVWNGPLPFGSFVQVGAMPQDWPFLDTIPVTTPFFYSPLNGNLLLDIRGRSGQVFLAGTLDSHTESGDPISSVFANRELLSSGTPATLGLVARFQVTIIPEPSAAILAVIGLGTMLIFNRRKS